MIVFITAGVCSLLTATIGVLIALKIQSRILRNTVLELEAWNLAQEAHQNIWEVKQRKQALELEQRLTKQAQQIQEAWQRWETRDAQRLEKLTLEQKLASLPRIEDVPIPTTKYISSEPLDLYGQQTQPPSFFRTNLQGQDLSHRYLEQADFREAQLENANFYMADLAGASFTGANLTGVNFAGANLSGADLRDAIVIGANLLVADLNGTILHGANLLGTHNLTPEQITSTIFNHETQFEFEVDRTLPRIASMQAINLKPSSDHEPRQFEPAIRVSSYNGKTQLKANYKDSKALPY